MSSSECTWLLFPPTDGSTGLADSAGTCHHHSKKNSQEANRRDSVAWLEACCYIMWLLLIKHSDWSDYTRISYYRNLSKTQMFQCLLAVVVGKKGVSKVFPSMAKPSHLILSRKVKLLIWMEASQSRQLRARLTILLKWWLMRAPNDRKVYCCRVIAYGKKLQY